MATAFPVEFFSDVPHVYDELRLEAESRLEALGKGHTDITGASVAVRQPAHTTTPYIYEARVVVYIKPESIVAVETADTMEVALGSALDAVERQVRQLRGKLGQPWKRHDFRE